MKQLLAVLICANLVLAGCGPSKEGAAPQKQLRLGFIANDASSFWSIAYRGCKAAERELGNVKVDFRIPPTGDIAVQEQMLEDMVADHENGIAISPVDPDFQTATLNQVAKRTLLLTQDSDAPKSARACYIGTDNIAAGEQAGQLIKEAIPQGGNIVLFVGNRAAQNARDRMAGIEKALAGSNVTN